MKVISVRLPEEIYEKLEARAELTGIAPAVLARAYLKESLEDRHDFSAAVVGKRVEAPETRRSTKKGSAGRSPNAKKKKRGR